jgi:hypothetical protein
MRVLLLLLLLAVAPAHAAITVDGRLDEPEWLAAQRFVAFATTVPNTQAMPELRTEVLVATDASGLYIGFICDQPATVPRVRSRNSRDHEVEADRVTAIVDFDGRGNTAYEFSVSISNGIRDAIVGNVLLNNAEGLETRFNTDWDGGWDHAVRETPEQWFVEIHLPWSVAPLGARDDGQLTTGMLFSRVVSALGQRYSQPGSQLDRPTLLADLQKVVLSSYDTRQLDVFPYVSGDRDFLGHGSQARAGVDVFWKPSPQHQLTATINPDFGQVEADALVVNFSAIPSFFPDKRPFFTENQSLFDTDTQLVYTRRIGAAPDAGTQGSSDILSAAKYTGGSGRYDYGLIAAVEDDSGAVKGRDFYIGRVRERLDERLTVGALLTHVERPELRRSADVQAVDLAWTLLPGATLRAQGMLSRIQRPDSLPDTPQDPAGSGNGVTLNLDYAPGAAWAHTLAAEHYSSGFGIDDAGYLERNNLDRLTATSTYTFRNEIAPGQVRQSSIAGLVRGAYNQQGQRLPATLLLEFKSQAPDASTATLEYNLADIGGADDLVTRGNGPVRFPSQSFLTASYSNPQTGLLRYTALAGISQGLFSGLGWDATLKTELHFTEHFIARARANFSSSPDYVIWQYDNVLASFRYRQVVASSGIDWFPAPRHELRLLFQWSAGSGHRLQAYRPDVHGSLHRSDDEVGSFSFGDVALQTRYRYELGPLSDLYLVYSRGGNVSREDDGAALGSLFSQAVREPTASQLLLKLRYRFRVF